MFETVELFGWKLCSALIRMFLLHDAVTHMFL